jgi:glycosyltransferase domain-containing protein
MNLTIMIATKNRPNFLIRALNYYSMAGFNGEIFIGDSSSEKNSKENLNIIDKNKNLKIFYHLDTKLSADQMVSFLSKKVKTNYSVMINDDDILIIPSIQNCIDFLDENPDFVAVNGRAYNIGINLNEPTPLGKISSVQLYPLAKYENETLIDRITNYFNNTLNVNMSIIRSELNMLAFSNVEKLNKFDSAFIFGELIHAITILANGKITSIDNCYLVRQKHSQQHYRKIDKDNWLNHTDLVSAIFELKNSIKEGFIKKNENFNEIINETVNHLIMLKVKYIFNRFISGNKIFRRRLKMFYNNLININNFLLSYVNNPVEKFFKKNEAKYQQDRESLKTYFNCVEKNSNFK